MYGLPFPFLKWKPEWIHHDDSNEIRTFSAFQYSLEQHLQRKSYKEIVEANSKFWEEKEVARDECGFPRSIEVGWSEKRVIRAIEEIDQREKYWNWQNGELNKQGYEPKLWDYQVHERLSYPQ